jgi:glycine cleavage system regulatory protein
MNRMGDQFGVMMMAAIKHEEFQEPTQVFDKLQRNLISSLNDGIHDDMHVIVLPAVEVSCPSVTEMATINVMGNDAEGIMKEVTSAVAVGGIDILSAMSKGPVSAPFSGETMFEFEMVVTVPEGTAMVTGADALCARLEVVEERFHNIDIQFELMDTAEVWQYESTRDQTGDLHKELILGN